MSTGLGSGVWSLASGPIDQRGTRSSRDSRPQTPDPRRSAFSLLEVILALIIAALVMAAIGPALVGTLHAQRQVRRVLEPLAAEQAALAMLRDDLLTAPRPNGSVTQPFTLTIAQTGGRRGDMLAFTSNGAPPMHPRVVRREPELGQAVITWALTTAEDGRGLAWTRSRQPHLLATGARPEPLPEVMVEHLAELTIETLVAGTWTTTFDSAQRDDVLPLAVRISFAYVDEKGEPGPRRVVVIDLPQVALDPLQNGGGTTTTTTGSGT